MDCSGCDNIPFWEWLKLVQNITISVSCNDFDGNQLSSLQQNNFTGCSGEYLCTWFWKCYQIYRMYIENIDHFVDEEKVEDTNEVARSHRSKDRQHNGQMKKDKQRSTKHYTENKRSSNTNPTYNLGWTQVLRISMQILIHIHLSSHSCYKPGDKLWMMRGKWKWHIPIHKATFIYPNQLPFKILSYITNLVCYAYFHWFFSPECQHIFGKQTGYIFQSPKTIKTWTTQHYASLNQWYNTE